MGEGNYYGIAVTEKAIFITANGDDTKGWIAKVEITDGKPGELKPAIATKQAQQTDAPGPIVVSPENGELVVGQKGEVNVAGDSLILTFDAESGELKKSYKTGLNDVVGLAYSPKTKKLYATDFSWVDPAKGALYRLDFEGEEAKPTKILDLDKPTALAFDKDGKLYVCIFGTGKEGSDKSPGELLLIDAGL
jgi:DNA-binding beta-propeller fold protein YncE